MVKTTKLENKLLNFCKVTLILSGISMGFLMGSGMSIDEYRKQIRDSSNQVEIVHYKNRIEDYKKLFIGSGIVTGISFLGFAVSSLYWRKKYG